MGQSMRFLLRQTAHGKGSSPSYHNNWIKYSVHIPHPDYVCMQELGVTQNWFEWKTGPAVASSHCLPLDWIFTHQP